MYLFNNISQCEIKKRFFYIFMRIIVFYQNFKKKISFTKSRWYFFNFINVIKYNRFILTITFINIHIKKN